MIKLNKILSSKDARCISNQTLQSSGVDLKQAFLKTLDDTRIGEFIPGEGIYFGLYEPQDRDEGRSLGKIFKAFAAPEDLPQTMKYAETIKYIANLENWCGFNGTAYVTDKEVYAALEDGSYKGDWIIPTRELLVGTEPDAPFNGIRKGKLVKPDNLFDLQKKKDLKGTFNERWGRGLTGFYWSCTVDRLFENNRADVRFSDGLENSRNINGFSLNCRPVRLVEVKP